MAQSQHWWLVIVVFVVLFLLQILLSQHSYPRPDIQSWKPQLGGDPSQAPISNAISGSQKHPLIRNIEWIDKPFYLPQADPRNPIAPDQSPTNQLSILINHYGYPDLLDTSPHGLAVWKKTTLDKGGHCLERIVLSDYQFNFVNVWIYFPLSAIRGDKRTKKIMSDIYDLHPNVDYDEIKKMIDLDANRYEDIFAILLPTLKLLSGHINLLEAQHLIETYLDHVNPNSPNYKPQAINYLENEVCRMQKANSLKQGNRS